MSKVNKSAELFIAIGQKNRRLAKKLILENDAELTGIRRQSLHVLLKVAVECRDELLVRKLLELQPNLSTAYGTRILWIVAEDGDTEIASMLVRAGANVNINIPYKPNFLHVLAGSKNPKKLELGVLMMEHGANLNVKCVNGYTALRCAIKHENLTFARELLKRNTLIERFDVYETVFSRNTLEWLMMFIDEYPNNEETRSERIANVISWLCEVDIDEMKIANWLNALLEVGIPDVFVFYKIVMCGKRILVKTILDSDRIDRNTKMMLLHAAMMLETSSMAQMLIEWGADVNYRVEVRVYPFPANVRPIHIACSCHMTENIKLLLRLGADINDAPHPHCTPLLIMMRADPILGDAAAAVIKHLAIMTTKGNRLNDQDLEMIYKDPCLQGFYEECLKELRDMQKLKVLNRFVFDLIFTANIKDVSLLTKRREFAKYCKRDFLYRIFPIYFEELNLRMTEAETRRDLLVIVENTLYDTLGQVLPDLVIDKIMFYLFHSDVYLNSK